MFELQTLVISSLAVIPAAYFAYHHFLRPARVVPQPTQHTTQRPLKTIMQPARDDLHPPKDDPYTTEELKKYDGSTPELPIYVAIKGKYHGK